MDISKVFASSVFDENIMEEKLSDENYKLLKKVTTSGGHLSLELADSVASAMKEWAMSKGATHFSHWFQPLSGFIAEKQDSFMCRKNYDKIIMSFSGKDLIKSEPDASSFPSGGLRNVYKAKGYAVWDPTSYAFVRNEILYIPAIFCTYTGEILDKKIPLLKSMELVDEYSRDLLKILGDGETHRVFPVAGIEQEFFLIDESLYNKRMDLKLCGRTLFGGSPADKQELNEHYYAKMSPQISRFMQALDIELWKLGILAKTKHCEAAASQYEIVPIHTTANVAADNNKLMMEIMKELARKYKLVCIFHEKPFDQINGSGKHLNWSLMTDSDQNLFDIGGSEQNPLKFFLFLTAVIKAIDEHQDLLKMCVASYQNDLRLGGLEAPPSILSIHLGEELHKALLSFSDHKLIDIKKLQSEEFLNVNIPTLPDIKKDIVDRNRSSPFAFTGDKFEFRMPGANSSIAIPIATLNIIVADEIKKIADALARSKNLKKDAVSLIADILKDHQRIIFNGDNYSKYWKNESIARGLSTYKMALASFDALNKEKNVDLFLKHKIYSKKELNSRYLALSQNYCKVAIKECRTLIYITKTQILPASFQYMKHLSEILLNKEKLLSLTDNCAEKLILDLFSNLTAKLFEKINLLENVIYNVNITDIKKFRLKYEQEIYPLISKIKSYLEQIEENLPQKILPYPNYKDLLFQF